MFGYRLALKLGRWDVDNLLKEMSSSQVSEWMAYERLEPFGFPAMNWLFSSLMALLANMFMKKKNSSDGFSPKEFEYNYAEELLHPKTAPEMTQQTLEEKFITVMKAFGAVITQTGE